MVPSLSRGLELKRNASVDNDDKHARPKEDKSVVGYAAFGYKYYQHEEKPK
jgi:hypothetical protein